MDEEFGAGVARHASEAGVPLAMPVERSGQDEFDFQYGAQFGEHIEAFDPTFVKVLVRYNPEGDSDMNRRQSDRLARAERLAACSEPQVPLRVARSWRLPRSWTASRGARTTTTTASVPASSLRRSPPCRRRAWSPIFGRSRASIRPRMPLLWCGRHKQVAVTTCCASSLGGEPIGTRLLNWLKVGAGVPGFAGFAVGRTLWHDALVDHLAGRSSEAETAKVIAERYRELIDYFTTPRAPSLTAVGSMTPPSDPPDAGRRRRHPGHTGKGPHRPGDRRRAQPSTSAGILFAITSGRPPRGMAMLIEPLDLQTPIAAFNGGLLVDRDMTVIEQRVVPEELVVPIADLMTSFGLSVWIYRGADWYVPDPKGPHVDREAWTVKFEPKVMSSVNDLTDNVAKIVGVSDDHEAVSKAAAAAHDRFGDHVTCRRIAALLPRRDPPPSQQGRGGQVPRPEIPAFDR